MLRDPMTDTAPVPSDTAALEGRRRSQFLRLWRRFSRNKGAVFGLFVLLAIVAASIFADTLSPYDPIAQDFMALMEPPSARHWLGTDSLGRDILSRMIYGSRIALIVGILAVLSAMLVGVTLGLIAGYYGGLIDSVIMRIMDGLFAFPILILAIALMAIMGLGLVKYYCRSRGWAHCALCPRHAGRCLGDSDRDLCGSGGIVGGESRGGDFSAHFAQRLGPDHCAGRPAGIWGHYYGSGLEFSGPWHSAANCGLGVDDQRGPAIHRHGPVDSHLSRHCLDDCRGGT